MHMRSDNATRIVVGGVLTLAVVAGVLEAWTGYGGLPLWLVLGALLVMIPVQVWVTRSVGDEVIKKLTFLIQMRFRSRPTVVVYTGSAGKNLKKESRKYRGGDVGFLNRVWDELVDIFHASPEDRPQRDPNARVKEGTHNGVPDFTVEFPKGQGSFPATLAVYRAMRPTVEGWVDSHTTFRPTVSFAIGSAAYSGVAGEQALFPLVARRSFYSMALLVGEEPQHRGPSEQEWKSFSEDLGSVVNHLLLLDNQGGYENGDVDLLSKLVQAVNRVGKTARNGGGLEIGDLGHLAAPERRGIVTAGPPVVLTSTVDSMRFFERLLRGQYRARFHKPITFLDPGGEYFAVLVGSQSGVDGTFNAFDKGPELKRLGVHFIGGDYEDAPEGVAVIALFAKLRTADLADSHWEGLDPADFRAPGIVTAGLPKAQMVASGTQYAIMEEVGMGKG